MKKTLAIVLALLMTMSLFACGQTPAPSPSASPSASAPVSTTPSTPVNTGKTGDQPLDKVGFFDPNFDYSKGERYKVQYMVLATGILYEQFSDAFAHWATKMNIDYGGLWAAGNDNDVFINNISTFASQGVDGLLLDPDVTVYPRIVEILDELKISWMPCMGPPRDVTDPAAPLLHPCVGFDHYQFGVSMATKLVEYKNTVWPDVAMEDVGFIVVDYSLSPPLHDRARGAQDAWNQLTGLTDNYLVADTASGQLTMDTANNMVTATISANGQYTHWLVATLFDDLAQGAAAAIDSLGLTEVSCVVTVGGSALQQQLDAGQEDAWRFAMFTPQNIYAEPIIGALYAMMSGQATAETIWPSWVNANDHGREPAPAVLLDQ
jgi:ABC-type sugar transport system substrate-binding protein